MVITPDRRFLTNEQMAEELGVTRHMIQAFLNRGELEYLWISNRRKVTRELWEDFLRRRRTRGPLKAVDGDD